MSVTIKSAREIELMREAGRILAKVHEELEKAIHPGMSTLDIDRLGEKLIREFGCVPSAAMAAFLLLRIITGIRLPSAFP